jgi:hypothetical protein
MNAVKVSSWQIKHFFDKQQSSTFFRQIIHLSELQEFTGATESFHFGWMLCIVVCFYDATQGKTKKPARSADQIIQSRKKGNQNPNIQEHLLNCRIED